MQEFLFYDSIETNCLLNIFRFSFMKYQYDVAGIGNPLLDLTLAVEDSFLEEFKLKKGIMHLLTDKEVVAIGEKLQNFEPLKSPGGSVANVLAGVSLLGGSSVMQGKIGDDNYGDSYSRATKLSGTVSALVKGKSKQTGYALTLISPDGERTFAVYLGAALDFKREDVQVDILKSSKILHLEGFKVEDSLESGAIEYAVQIAQENGVQVSLDLSDGELVKRNYDYLQNFVKKYVDIVFANEVEALAFTKKKNEEAVEELSKVCDIAIVKIGEGGSFIKVGGNLHRVKAYKTRVINTNGAGDMYAAGILYGLTNGIEIVRAAEQASKLAARVVATDAARLEKDDF